MGRMESSRRALDAFIVTSAGFAVAGTSVGQPDSSSAELYPEIAGEHPPRPDGGIQNSMPCWALIPAR